MSLAPRHSWQPTQSGLSGKSGKSVVWAAACHVVPMGMCVAIPLAWGLGGSGPGSAMLA